MVRSKRLKPIRKMAQDKEKAAAQALGQSLELQTTEQQKLTQLKQYRQEYLAEMMQKVATGINGASLQHYHHFLNKIDEAISQQDEVLCRCGEKLTASQGEWRDKRSHAKAITQVMDKMSSRERKALDKKEANQNDELSTQAFLRRQGVQTH